MKRVVNTATVLFALIGVFATYRWGREYAARPHHFAKPYSFLILDIENPKDPQATTRIYLDSPAPRYVLRDRDAIYGGDFADMTRDMGMEEVLTAPRSPWQHPFAERLVGSI